MEFSQWFFMVAAKAPAVRIGEVSRRTGLSRDTIRFYERAGLIRSLESLDPNNSYRRYTEANLERLEMITQARAVGFSVADLKRLFDGLDGMATGEFDAEEFIDAKIAELRFLVARSKRLVTMLLAAKRAIATRP